MRIEEIMTRDVDTCGPAQTGADAAKIMWDRDCGCVPIVDGDGHPIGIVTDRDLCMAVYTRGTPLHEIRVDSVMSISLHTCTPIDSIETAERLMSESRVRRLPVVGHRGDLVGIVSLGDVARARRADVAGRVVEHVLSDVATTLAAIVEPRRAPAPHGRPS